MTGPQVREEIRSVLTAPRGQRFHRPGERPPRELIPRVTASRMSPPRSVPAKVDAPRPGSSRSEMPWEETYQARRERLLRQLDGNPRVAYMLQHGPVPHWVKVARKQREQNAREAAAARRKPNAELPRGRHRAPRSWWGWPAMAMGASLLYGLHVLDTVGPALAHNIGILT